MSRHRNHGATGAPYRRNRMSLVARLTSLLLMSLVATTARAETVWFVMAEVQEFHGDSFLLPLSDPEHIAQARARLAQGAASGVGSIASARIAAGADGLNRDVRAPGAPLWSWHVTAFDGFADATIELCDGWPTFVERDPVAFIRNTGGAICFWSYQLVAELPAAPAFAVSDALAGAWYNAATPGQGFFIDVLAESRQLFVGWFTYEGSGAASRVRWVTAQGPYAGARAELVVTATTGGAFDRPDPVQNVTVGTLRIDFADCTRATATYSLDGAPGTIALTRIAPNANCR
jgi:hypothetical protein